MKLRKYSKWFFLLLGAGLAFSIQVFAKPAQIVIIRHGEKPDTGAELAPQGCERAYSLPKFFAKDSTVEQFGKPVAIFAMRPNTSDSSVRPVQTIAPTANELGLKINDSFTRLEYDPIVKAILNDPTYNGKTVLISWEHKAIPGLAEAFGVSLSDDTQKWPGIVFDEAWVIQFSADGPSLQIIPENALSTDNPRGGKHWGDGPTSDAAPEVSSDLANTCQNNDALNALVHKWVSPDLPILVN